MAHVKKHIGFSGLRKTLSLRFQQTQDPRKGDVDYCLHDFFMSAFAMMYFQDPSLLQFQRRMQKSLNRNNLNTVFNVQDIPKDTQLRDVLDISPTKELEKIFTDFLRHLQRGKHLEAYQFLNGMYLIPIDGTEKQDCEINAGKRILKKIRKNHPKLKIIITGDGLYSKQPFIDALKQGNRPTGSHHFTAYLAIT
ncbi:MAG: hypothetical protein KAH06_03245 [Desulfobacterales bacterium]|nr:hypothetical protein [Desulfobacterales bacterium]